MQLDARHVHGHQRQPTHHPVLAPTSSPGILERPSAPGRCMSASGSPPWATDYWDRVVVKGLYNSSWQRLQAPTSAARIAAYIPMPSMSPHPHCYATQCGAGIEGCVWEVNLWLRFPRDVWAMSGHASSPPCCSRKAALWTLATGANYGVWSGDRWQPVLRLPGGLQVPVLPAPRLRHA